MRPRAAADRRGQRGKIGTGLERGGGPPRPNRAAAAATVIASTTAIKAAPSTVADPRSPAHSPAGSTTAIASAPRVSPGTSGASTATVATTKSPSRRIRSTALRRSDASHGDGGRCVIPACRQPGRFPGGVDAADLRADRGESADAEHQHRHQRGHRQCRLHGAETGVTC